MALSVTDEPEGDASRWSANQRGYLVATLAPDRLIAEYRFVDDVADPDSTVAAAATFEIAAGTRTITGPI